MSLTRPLQHSDYCNSDIGEESALSGDGGSYGSENHAGRGAKCRLGVRVDAQGRYVGLCTVRVEDAKPIYEANAEYRRNLKPVDPAEIVYPRGCAVDLPSGRYWSALEISGDMPVAAPGRSAPPHDAIAA
jgi:hypothetical protein